MSSIDLVSDSGETPVIGNSKQDNGIVGYSNYSPTNKGDTITFSDTVDPSPTLFYQIKPFIGYSHVDKLEPICKHKITLYENLYIISAIKQSLKGLFNYTKKSTAYITDIMIALPKTSNNHIDWHKMDRNMKYIINNLPNYHTKLLHQKIVNKKHKIASLKFQIERSAKIINNL